MKRALVVCGLVAAIGCGGSGGGGGGGTGGAAPGTAGTLGTAGATGTGGTGACVTGNEGCACYGNDSCNGTLQCFSHLCVSLTGTAGATGTGGSVSGGAGTGGSGAGTAGTTGGAGATGVAGTSGTAGTTGGAGTTGSAGTSGSAGATGTAGTSGTAGTTGAAGRGGTTGTAGTGGASSGATLSFTAGVVTAGSNSIGVTGGVYSFKDSAGSTISPNCQGGTCFSSLNGAGPFCVSGTNVQIGYDAQLNPDYATYWGAAVAIDLNNPTNTANAQLDYKASDYNVKGFQFTFTNNATSTVRLTFKVRDLSTNGLADYCLDLPTTATSTIHFSDAKLNCYAGTPGPALSGATADHVVGLQWQVPSSLAGAVAFNFCIGDITAITQ